MPPVEFKPTISAGELPQTYALGSATTGTGKLAILDHRNLKHVGLQYSVHLGLITMQTVTNISDYKIFIFCVLGWLSKLN